MYTYMCMCLHTYMYTYKGMHICSCTCIRINIRLCLSMYLSIYLSIDLHSYAGDPPNSKTQLTSVRLEARFLAKLHRRRFEAARAAHPWETRVQLAGASGFQ